MLNLFFIFSKLNFRGGVERATLREYLKYNGEQSCENGLVEDKKIQVNSLRS